MNWLSIQTAIESTKLRRGRRRVKNTTPRNWGKKAIRKEKKISEWKQQKKTKRNKTKQKPNKKIQHQKRYKNSWEVIFSSFPTTGATVTAAILDKKRRERNTSQENDNVMIVISTPFFFSSSCSCCCCCCCAAFISAPTIKSFPSRRSNCTSPLTFADPVEKSAWSTLSTVFQSLINHRSLSTSPIWSSDRATPSWIDSND